MKRIEVVLPKVIPSQVPFDPLIPTQRNLEPFARIGIVPTESSAYKAVNMIDYRYINLCFFRDCVLMI